jgi:lambda family phage minor tail protein L
MTIDSVVQKLAPGVLVTMYELDLAPLGVTVDPVVRFTPNQATVVWNGNTYTPADVEADGFEWSGSGPLPRPTIKVSNINRVFSAMVRDYQDAVGAKLTRIRTFAQFLDNGSDPDPTAIYPLDIYTVDSKEAQTKIFVQWKLTAAMDQQGRKLPGRQVLRDTCTHRYRVWDTTLGDFDYSKATCPYTGVLFFDANGDVVVSGANDVCGKRFTDCEKRFGVTVALPTRAFPGAARIRR